MSEETDIRHIILRQAAECKSAIGWENALYNDIATRLILEEYVRGEISAGGTAVITGIWDKGRKEIECQSISGKTKHLSKRLVLLIWAAIVAVIVYVMQLDAVKIRLSNLIDGILK
jgi:hypothetical protein